MSSLYAPHYTGPNRAYNYRPPAAQPPTGPPLDDVEPWYLYPSPYNRMVLALESGILSEVSWSLNKLIRISASDQRAGSPAYLPAYPTLPTALCEWPEWFLSHANDEDGVTFSPNPKYTVQKRLALNSMLVLKNMALIDENSANILARCQRIRTLVFAILERYQHPTDTTLEFLLAAMDLFRYTIQKWPAAPSPEQVASLVSIVGHSNDRAILISGWGGLHNLLDAFTTTLLANPDSAALAAAIKVLPLHLDPLLTTAALDYMLAHLSYPSLAKAFLHHPAMPQVVRLLAQQLLWDQTRVLESVTSTLGGTPKTMIARNNAIGVFELSREELDEIATQSEPIRVTTWMQRMFEVAPGSEMTQVEFWNLYKAAFAQYGPELMLPATELIKLVTSVFPTAMAMVVSGSAGKAPKFVIKGLERRRAAAESRTKCHWDEWGCPEPPFTSPLALYNHVKLHLAENSTTVCRWGSCTYQCATRERFEAHLLTHLPLQFSSFRHPGQVDDVIIPPHNDAETMIPIVRPVPPGPPQQVTYQRPREDPPSSSFTALLIMRILYRTSFTQSEVVTRTDGEHFGFPGIEQSLGETEDGSATEDFGLDSFEGQKRGKAAFKAIGGMLANVQIHDATIATWIDEMLDSIKSLPVSL